MHLDDFVVSSIRKTGCLGKIHLPVLCTSMWVFHPTTHIPVLMKITVIKLVCFVSAQLAFYCSFVTSSGWKLLLAFFFFPRQNTSRIYWHFAVTRSQDALPLKVIFACCYALDHSFLKKWIYFGSQVWVSFSLLALSGEITIVGIWIEKPL